MNNVRLIWITPNAEDLIAYIARVSNPENQDNPEYAKLIRYLIKNKHWSPFEMVNAAFEIKTSRAISAQIIRHRSFSFQEFSQRYSNVIDIEHVELRKQGKTNRQSSEDVVDPYMSLENVGIGKASELVDITLQQVKALYRKLIETGVSKETARMILPMASSTTIYMNGNLRSWIHYLKLRNDQHAQKEHRLIAEQIEQMLRIQFPIVFQALDSLTLE